MATIAQMNAMFGPSWNTPSYNLDELTQTQKEALLFTGTIDPPATTQPGTLVAGPQAPPVDELYPDRARGTAVHRFLY